MDRCYKCRHAEWDYETYYGTSKKQWFVSGCKLDEVEEECPDYEEEEDE